ncbi:MAG TPA: hypothetical protein VN944_00115 [Nitrospiria bacterium]|nr:hypothetical protein [Nitrospiria bacterium]
MFTLILNQIKSYLIEEISMRGLESWLISHLQEILDSREADSIILANHLDADFVELQEGTLDELIFKTRIQNYLNNLNIQLDFQGSLNRIKANTATCVKTLNEMWDFRPVTDIRFTYSPA